MKSFVFSDKAKQVEQLKQQLKDMTADRDNLLKATQEQEKKIEDHKQASAAFSLGSQQWEKEKQALIETHKKELEAAKTQVATVETAKVEAVKEATQKVEEIKEQHKAELIVTDEKVNKAVAVKMNAMNLSEVELPAAKDEKLTIKDAVKQHAALTGKQQKEFYQTHKALFAAYLRNSNVE